MLIPRILTAIALLAVLLPALFAGSADPLAAVTLVLIVAACWEWGRLNQAGGWWSAAIGIAVGVALAMLWWLPDESLVMAPAVERVIWLVASAVWVLGAAFLIRSGVGEWAKFARWARLILGWLLLATAWWALARARALGVNFLLSLLVLVWVADVAAYFGGRAWGKRKLAVAISPGKTWAGALSGLVAVLLLSFAWLRLDQADVVDSASVFSVLWGRQPVVALIGVIFLVTMAVIGDLIESLVKRSAGVKDSSGLLPGHGGVLDRVDALLPVLPIGMMLVTV